MCSVESYVVGGKFSQSSWTVRIGADASRKEPCSSCFFRVVLSLKPIIVGRPCSVDDRIRYVILRNSALHSHRQKKLGSEFGGRNENRDVERSRVRYTTKPPLFAENSIRSYCDTDYGMALEFVPENKQ